MFPPRPQVTRCAFTVLQLNKIFLNLFNQFYSLKIVGFLNLTSCVSRRKKFSAGVLAKVGSLRKQRVNKIT